MSFLAGPGGSGTGGRLFLYGRVHFVSRRHVPCNKVLTPSMGLCFSAKKKGLRPKKGVNFLPPPHRTQLPSYTNHSRPPGSAWPGSTWLCRTRPGLAWLWLRFLRHHATPAHIPNSNSYRLCAPLYMLAMQQQFFKRGLGSRFWVWLNVLYVHYHFELGLLQVL